MNINQIEIDVIKKVTLRLIPFLFIVFVTALVDRMNVSFAALSMNADLGFSNEIYGLGAGMFFIGYFLMEIPGNLIMCKVGAKFWITRIMISWGIISGLTAFVTTPEQFYIARFALGLAEASFFPAIVYYLSEWYRCKDQIKAISLFMLAVPVCNIINAPISTYLLGVSWLSWAGWHWMFVIEAIPALILGVISYYYLTDKPEDAKWLNESEKSCLICMLKEEKIQRIDEKKYTLFQTLKDRDIWIMVIAYFFWMTGQYGVMMFLPILVKSLSSTMSNMVVGYWIMALWTCVAISLLLVGRSSTKTGKRKIYVITCMAIAAVGLFSSVYFTNVNIYIAMICYTITLMGAVSSAPVLFSIPATFLTGASTAVALALINSVGNLGGFCGPYLTGYINTATNSFTIPMIVMSAAFAISAMLMILIRKSN